MCRVCRWWPGGGIFPTNRGVTVKLVTIWPDVVRRHFFVHCQRVEMTDSDGFYYEVNPNEPLSMEVVTAIARAHDEDVIDQEWRISEDINTDALDGLFQDRKLDMTLQFEADDTTATIMADRKGKPVIKIKSHR